MLIIEDQVGKNKLGVNVADQWVRKGEVRMDK